MLPDATVVGKVLSAAGVSGAEIGETTLGLVCRVAPDDALAALAALKASELGFVMLVDLLGIDTGEAVDVVYHLRSFSRDEEMYVKTTLPYDATLPSVWEVYPAALMPERETAELYGLSLSGHPNPKRLLTMDGVAPLLRKSVHVRTAEEMRDR